MLVGEESGIKDNCGGRRFYLAVLEPFYTYARRKEANVAKVDISGRTEAEVLVYMYICIFSYIDPASW